MFVGWLVFWFGEGRKNTLERNVTNVRENEFVK